MSWEPPKPPTYLSKEELNAAYNTSVSGFVQVLTDLINTEGGIDRIINEFDGPLDLMKRLMPNPVEMMYSLTREGVTVIRTDMMPEFVKRGGVGFDTAEHVTYFDPEGEPLMSSVNVFASEGRSSITAEANAILDAVMTELNDAQGVSAFEATNMVDVNEVFKAHVQKSEDDMVKEFTSSLDDIFATWEGGET